MFNLDSYGGVLVKSCHIKCRRSWFRSVWRSSQTQV